jgi:hypothetical protein
MVMDERPDKFSRCIANHRRPLILMKRKGWRYERIMVFFCSLSMKECSCSLIARFLPIAMVTLSGCSTPSDPAELDRPLFGGEETRFVMQPGSGELRLRDAVAIAKVLRKYRDITAAEKALIKLAVRRHIDGLVALELRKLEQEAAPERARIRKLADPVARKQADAELDAKLLAEAARRVAAKMDKLLAVPLRTSSPQSVVSFARVVSDDIRVADAAYELDLPRNQTLGPQISSAPPSLEPELLGTRKSGSAVAVLETEQDLVLK